MIAVVFEPDEIHALLRQDRVRNGERDNGYTPASTDALDRAISKLDAATRRQEYQEWQSW